MAWSLYNAQGSIQATDVPTQGVVTMLNVKDFGAKGDGSTNDATAIQAAINAAGAAGVSGRGVDLYFPAGVYAIGSVIAVPFNNVMLRGAGWQSTVLYATYTTGDILQIGNGTSKSGCGLMNMSVWCNAARTTGANIYVNAMNDCLIQNFVVNNCFQGILIGGVSLKVWIDQGEINNIHVADGAGIKVTNGAGGDVYIKDIVMSNPPASKPLYGIHVEQVGHISIIRCNVTSCVKGLMVNPTTGMDVSYMFIDHSLFDSCGSHAAHFSPLGSATGRVRSVMAVNSWFSGTLATGGGIEFTIASSAICDGLSFIGCRILNNYNHGVIIGAGPTNISFTDCTIAGNGQQTSNTYDGISIAANASGVSAMNCKIGQAGTAGNQQRYAVNVAAGTSANLYFVGNDCQPNGTVGTNGYINLGALTGGGNVFQKNAPCVFSGDGQASVAASGAITSTETIIHPVRRYMANAIYPGTTWHFKATGTCTITTAAAVPGRFVVRMGTNGSTPSSDTAVATFTLGTSAGISGPIVFSVDIYITCRTVGASASFMAYLQMLNAGTTGIFTAAVQGPLQAAMATVASTNALYVYLTYGLSGSANVSCTFQEVSMSVETPGNNN